MKGYAICLVVSDLQNVHRFTMTIRRPLYVRGRQPPCVRGRFDLERDGLERAGPKCQGLASVTYEMQDNQLQRESLDEGELGFRPSSPWGRDSCDRTWGIYILKHVEYATQQSRSICLH
jgi:hypothetical protein